MELALDNPPEYEKLDEPSEEDASTEQTPVVDEEAMMKEHRRTELLVIARKARLRWILEAREKKIEYNSITTANNNNKKASNNSKMEFYKKVPAASCLQEVVDFLVDMTVSDTSDDKEYINIETLAPADGIDDELLDVTAEELPTFDNMHELSPYSILLEKLKHSSATEIVNIMRKFVSKIEVYVRDGAYPSASPHGTIQPTVSATSTATNTTTTDQPLDLPQEIFDLMEQLEQLCLENILWSSETPTQFSETMAALERFLFHKLYKCLFPQIMKNNVDKDEMLKERIKSLAFLDPEHLDIVPLKKHSPERSEPFLKLKQKLKIKETDVVNMNNMEMTAMQLNMQNVHTEGLTEAAYLLKYSLSAECFSPQEKMNCLRDISQSVIATITANQSQSSATKQQGSLDPSSSLPSSASVNNSKTPPGKKKKTPPGADDLLPALILAIKEANPPHLLSAIGFLETYLYPKKLFSEAGYILTHFVSAVQFLEHVNADALTISPLEFEESMYRCKHGGASHMRILQEENEMKEKLLYKRRVTLQNASATSSSGDTTAVPHQKHASTVGQNSVHNIYKRLQHSRNMAVEPTALSEDMLSDAATRHKQHLISCTDKRANHILLQAHDSYGDSESQQQILAAWSRGSRGSTPEQSQSQRGRRRRSSDEESESASERRRGRDDAAASASGLVNYFSASPDMLTMSDIPRILAEYKFLVKACVAMADKDKGGA